MKQIAIIKGFSIKLAISILVLVSYSLSETQAQRVSRQDTFANSISEYFGLSFRSPTFSDSPHSLGQLSGGTDFHVGLQYNRSVPFGNYLLVRLGVARYQNKIDYTRIVKNLLTNADSAYLETIVTDFSYTNSYLMVDAGLGLGRVISFKAWALDVNFSATYRAFAIIDGNRINNNQETVAFDATDFKIPAAHLVLGADAALRWYMDKEAYFTFGIGYQRATEISHTSSGAVFDFSTLTYKIGYGFDF